MNMKLLHTPDGVRDIYNGECERKLELEKRLRSVLFSYGCRPIETPSFEFFDVFGTSVGTTPSRDLYKFFDRDGNTLVLRPDFTPAVARAASKYFMEYDHPIRLCYLGSTFVNQSSYRGILKETTQMGAELIGDASADADAEVLAMVVESLLKAGLSEFQISIGHAGYFEGLARAAGLEKGDCEELKDLIRNRNSFGAEKLVSTLGVSKEMQEAFITLPELFGGVEVLDRAAALAYGETSTAAISRLKEVYELLKLYGYEKYVSFDLGMLGNYMYYTGIIFRGYTYGTGDAIVKGGRYDSLLEQFGKKAASTGFVIVVDQLLAAMDRQKIPVETEDRHRTITYKAEDREKAVREAVSLRREGYSVELCLDQTAGDEKDCGGDCPQAGPGGDL